MNQQQDALSTHRFEWTPRRANSTPRRAQTRTSAVTNIVASLLLASCGGGASPTPVPAAPPAAPAPAPQGLLTDLQLSTGPDANEALVDGDAATWFSQNANVVRSLTVDTDFSDLSFLATSVQNKRLVMLGESGHGVKEYSQAKVRLIKYLHEEQGFNLLAFESGLFDCENGQRLIDNPNTNQGTAPLSAMRSCLFGVWQTQTLLTLFEYIQDTQSSPNPLRITGFDVQSSGSSSTGRADYTADMVAKSSPDYAARVRELEQEFERLITSARAATAADIQPVAELTSRLDDLTVRYIELADYLQANVTAIASDGDFSERDVLIAAQYARTSPYFAEQLSQRFESGGGIRPRDKGMAENFIALATDLYPNEKIIGWAHNAHLRHQGTGFLPDGNMGALVHDRLEADLYTIGFYMYRGEHAFNDRSIQPISRPLNYSLEAIFYTRRLAWLFLDIENSNSEPGAEWLKQATPTYTSGRFQIVLNLNAEYDGLFIIDTVTPPDYL